MESRGTGLLVLTLANLTEPLLASAIADRVQRRWQLVGTCAALAIFGLIFPQMRSALGIILAGVLITLSTSTLSHSFHAYQAEPYPARIRSRAIGLTYAWSRFGMIFVGFAVAFFLRDYGTLDVFAFTATAMIVCCLVIATMGPPTTRLRLEQISH